MLGSQYDITIQQGSTFELFLTVKDSNDAVRNLEGYEAEMQIRPSYASNTVIESLSSNTGEITLVGGAAGKINISLSAARTAAIKVDLSSKKLPKSTYVYDLELTDDEGRKYKLMYGDVNVYGEVTR
jgi:hypothetical protein